MEQGPSEAQKQNALRQAQAGEARSDTTPASRLHALYREATDRVQSGGGTFDERNAALSREQPVFDALARNPNAPPDLLRFLLLYAGVADAVCQNPVAPFLLLEDPAWLQKLNNYQQRLLLRSPFLPASLAAYLASGAVENPLAADPKSSTSTSYNLPQNAADITDEAKQHVALAGELAPETWQNAVRAFFQNYCLCPWSTLPKGGSSQRDAETERELHLDLMELGLVPSWAVGTGNHDEPKVWQKSRISYEEPNAAFAHDLSRAFDADVSPELLRRLAFYDADPCENFVVRLAIVLHPSCPPDLLGGLAQQPRRSLVETAVALHINTPPLVLERVFHQSGWNHVPLAANPSTPVPLLTQLAQSDDPLVRRLVRRNPAARAFARTETRKAALTKNRKMGFAQSHIEPPLSLVVRAINRDPPERISQYPPEMAWWVMRLALALQPYSNAEAARNACIGLSHDGNRLVRASARARLVDPFYRFEWEPSVP